MDVRNFQDKERKYKYLLENCSRESENMEKKRVLQWFVKWDILKDIL